MTAAINRRHLLAAAPVAVFMPAVAAEAACSVPVETPVMRAYREWRSFSAWVNSPATRGMDEEAFEALTAQLTAHVNHVIATQSESQVDVLIKMLVAVEDYQLFCGIEPLEAVEAEARALVGA